MRVSSTLRRGQATLSLVLLIGGIASAIVLAIALISISMISTGFAADQLQRARAAALGGIEDATLRLARNPADSGAYSVAVGAATSSVTITQGVPSAGYVQVIAQASAGARQSSLLASYALDPTTGAPTLVSLGQN